MKTISEIKSEIKEIADIINTEDLKKSVENKPRRKIAHLNQCILYLETNPDPNYLSTEIKRIGKKVETIMGGWKPTYVIGDFRKAKKAYEKEYGVIKLKEQVKTMQYLLKS